MTNWEEETRKEFKAIFGKKFRANNEIDFDKAELLGKLYDAELNMMADYWLSKLKSTPTNWEKELEKSPAYQSLDELYKADIKFFIKMAIQDALKQYGAGTGNRGTKEGGVEMGNSV